MNIDEDAFNAGERPDTAAAGELAAAIEAGTGCDGRNGGAHREVGAWGEEDLRAVAPEDEEDVDNGPDECVGPDEMPRDRTYAGVAPGRYEWHEDLPRTVVPPVLEEVITTYRWSDGLMAAKVYVELDGLDDLPDEALLADSGANSASLTIFGGGDPPKRQRLALSNLGEIESVTVERRRGKNTVVLKLHKKAAGHWARLEGGEKPFFVDPEDDTYRAKAAALARAEMELFADM